MRRHLAALEGRRVAAVVGSFHAWALLDVDKPATDPAPQRAGKGAEVVTSLVPYAFSSARRQIRLPGRDP